MISFSGGPHPGLLVLLLAAFTSAAAGSPSLLWQSPIEVAAGRGERGPWQQNESRYDYVDDPAVAIDGRGDVAMVWVDQGRKDVLFQRFQADRTKPLTQAVNVSRSPTTFSWLPRVLVAPANPRQVFVLWQEIIFSGGSHGGEIFFASSQDGGASFSAPTNLSNSIGGDGKGRINKEIWHNGSFDLALGADGMLYAAWTEYDGALWFSRSMDGGHSFSRPVRLAGNGHAKPARGPSLASAPGQVVYLAWTVGDDEGADIRVAKSTDGGANFTEPRVVAPNKTYSDAPKLAVDGTGILHLAYAEGSGGPFETYRIRYTRSADGARSFEAARDLSATLPPFSSAGFPHLCVDNSGRIYMAWDLFRGLHSRPSALGMTFSLDGGGTFAVPFLVPGSNALGGGTNGSQQGLLMKKLAANDSGAIAIGVSSLKQDDRSRVWLLRGTLRKTEGQRTSRPLTSQRPASAR